MDRRQVDIWKRMEPSRTNRPGGFYPVYLHRMNLEAEQAARGVRPMEARTWICEDVINKGQQDCGRWQKRRGHTRDHSELGS